MHRMAMSLAVCGGYLLFANSVGAAITDDGSVVIEPDGSLSIGSEAFGSRTVDGEADGAYPSASLGLLTGGHGELFLTGAASFETTGQLSVGRLSGSVIDVSGGSRLLTGSARLDIDSSSFDDIIDPVQVRIAGSGTEWINSGFLHVGGWTSVAASAEINVTAGARVKTAGALAFSSNAPWSRADITVEGLGTSWENSGKLTLFENATFSVRGGATAADASVLIGTDYYTGHAVVDGAGSIWRTGSMDVGGSSIFSNNVPLLVQNGGHLESTSARLSSQTTQRVVVRGVDSAWLIAGRLEVFGNGAGGDSHLRVEDGGLLEAGETHLGIDTAGHTSLNVIGTGATFRNAGELLVVGGRTTGAAFGVLDGAQATTNTMRVGCGNIGPAQQFGYRCEVSVTGASSLLTVLEDAHFSSDPSNGDGVATWTVGAGGRVEIGQIFTVVDSARVSLTNGSVSAAQLALQGGALTGDGSVQGIVDNAGLIAPGASIGRLAIDGSYMQDANGTLSITLGGLTPGVSHDVLEVLGTSDLAGKLRVELASGYLPNLGDSFEILVADLVLGTFDTLEGLDLSPSLALMVDYQPDRVVLVTTLVPEPGTALLMGAGLIGLAALRRSRSGQSRRLD